LVEGGERLEVYRYVFTDGGVGAATSFYGDDAFAEKRGQLAKLINTWYCCLLKS
jgi:hypothetical protein